MFSRLLVATDLSPASFAVVNCLGGLRQLGARHCLVLQCLNLRQAASVALSHTTDPLEDFLNSQKTILESQGFEVETRIVPGFAKQEINRIADQENYSLVVIGSHGHSTIGEALLGGVAYEVIHSARKPVLVVRLAKQPGADDECVQATHCDFGGHVLFPTDFSENADAAFAYLMWLAESGAARVTLLHVVTGEYAPPGGPADLATIGEIDRGRLEQLKALLERGSKSAVEIELCRGSAFRQIMRIIREQDVSLVVMGSQGRGFIDEIRLGSVSHNVVRHAPAPVLLIPATRRSTAR